MAKVEIDWTTLRQFLPKEQLEELNLQPLSQEEIAEILKGGSPVGSIVPAIDNEIEKPIVITHDECLNRILKVMETLDFDKVCRAFLCSLSSRRLEWRSPLTSFVHAAFLKSHTFTTHTPEYYFEKWRFVPKVFCCSECEKAGYGISSYAGYSADDLYIADSLRSRIGGAIHAELDYIMLDLEYFSKLGDIPEPNEEDIRIFKEILTLADSCAVGESPGKLRDKLKTIKGFKSNHYERGVLLDKLSELQILKPKSLDRRHPVWSDWAYFKYWKGGDGYQKDRVDMFFGKYINPDEV